MIYYDYIYVNFLSAMIIIKKKKTRGIYKVYVFMLLFSVAV